MGPSETPRRLVNSQDRLLRVKDSTTQVLRQVWSDVLDLDVDDIHETSHFFQLGGDSLATAQLVLFARRRGVTISRQSVFEAPVLSELAKHSTASPNALDESLVATSTASLQPFALAGCDHAAVRQSAGEQCHVPLEEIVDIYPVTALQAGLMARSLRVPGAYLSTWLINVLKPMPTNVIAECVARVVRKLPILRTAFVSSADHGFVQVVLSSPIRVVVDYTNSLNDIDVNGRRPEMTLGKTLTKFEVIVAEDTGKVWLLWHAHHATYDMTSVGLVLQHLADSMSGCHELSAPPNYASFVEYTLRLRQQEEAWPAFWRTKLSEARQPLFPYMLDPQRTTYCTDRQHRQIIQRPQPKSSFTTPNIFRAAWAFLLSSYERSEDVIFGAIGGGRYAPVEGCGKMVGPAIATSPVRTHVSPDMTVAQLLQQVTMDAVEACSFEQVGLANIQSLGPDEARACQFRTLVNVQVDDAHHTSDYFTCDQTEEPERLDYPLVLELFSRDKDHLRMHLSYDSYLLRAEQVAQIASQLDQVTQAFSMFPNEILRNITTHLRCPCQTKKSSSMSRSNLHRHAAVECGVGEGQIEYLCKSSAVQGDLFRHCQKEAYNHQIIFDVARLPRQISVIESIGHLIAKTTRLRTRFIQIPAPERGNVHEHESDALLIYEVIVATEVTPSESDDLDASSNRDRETRFAYGQPLIRITSIYDQTYSVTSHVIVTIANALCDEDGAHEFTRELDNLMAASVDCVSNLADSSTRSAPAPAEAGDERFWKHALGTFSGSSFPSTPLGYRPSAESSVSATWNMSEFFAVDGASDSVVFEVSWALVLGVYGQSADVSFGVLRECQPSGSRYLDTVAPALLPQRIELGDGNATVCQLVEDVKSCKASHDPYTGSSIKTISGFGGGCKASCDFQTIVKFRRSYQNERTKTLFPQASELRPAIIRHAIEISVLLQDEVAQVTMRYDPSVVEALEAGRLLSHYKHVVAQVCNQPGILAKDIEHTPKEHLEELIGWNNNVEEPLDRRVHDLFEERVNHRPYDAAVCARDGQWTFCELNDAAERLARSLRRMGLQPGMFVPLLFEKCGLAIVAMIAVLKAGGANVALDPSHPPERLKGLIRGMDHPFVLCSAGTQALAVQLGSRAFALTPKTMATVNEQPRTIDLSKEVKFGSDITAFVLFTSGSTGAPKGISIPHRTFSSSIRGHSKALRFSTGIGSRNFQFTAYTSDVSIGEIFTSLAMGSCVCVPSDWDRKNDIAGAINDLRANWAFFTPSVAALLRPADVPGLRTMVFGGETASQQNFDTWGPALHLINSFGPAECSIWTHCMPRAVRPGDDGSNIGYSLGDATWITDPTDYNRLLPIGAVGEMLIEGPNIAAGYLNEPEKTAKTFIHDPLWMTAVGRESMRLYRSGDLARFLPNGMVQFLGRNDHQIKLNGLRIELGEIEHQIRKFIPDDLLVAVDVITPYPPGSPHMLAAFIAPRDGGKSAAFQTRKATIGHGQSEQSTVLLSSNEGVFKAIRRLHKPLADILPSHMVPKAFISLCDMPLTASAKTDRKQLKLFSSMLSAEEISNLDFDISAKQAPSAILELVIARIWSQALGREMSLDVQSNFFKIGGNSLSAMKVVSLARKDGIHLTVEDVFQHPTLQDLATVAAEPQKQGVIGVHSGNHLPQDVAPFAMLQSEDATRISVANASVQLMVEEGDIEDIYACSPLQEGLMALSQDARGSYIAQVVFDLPDDLDMQRFKSAWEAVIREWPILRTRLFHLTMEDGPSSLMQAVVACLPAWRESTDLSHYLVADRDDRMLLGDPMIRLSIVASSGQAPRQFVLTAHHAVYDGWMLVLLLSAVSRNYAAHPPLPVTPYNAFIKYLGDRDGEGSRKFWREYLRGASRTCWPEFPTPGFRPSSTNRRVMVREQPASGFQGFTFATLARAAFGLLLGAYAHSADVIYASTVHGRVLGEFSAETVGGPTLATVPVRIALDRSQSIQDLLAEIQTKSAQMLEHEQEGMQNIRRHNASALASIDAQSLLVVQVDPPQSEITTEAESLMRERTDMVPGTGFLGSALVIEAVQTGEDICLKATFDDLVVPIRQAERFLGQMHHAIHQMCNNHQQTLAELDLVSEEEVQEMYTWNSVMPAPQQTLIHELVKARAKQQPTAEALVSFEGSVTYKELDDWSDRLAGHMWSNLGLRSGARIPLLFEKSLWTVIAMMAVLKIGAAFAALNPEHPPGRLRSLIQDIDAEFVICSEKYRSLATEVCDRHLCVGQSTHLEQLYGTNAVADISPVDLAFLLFTSGSTGKPKAIMIDHTAFTSSIKGHAQILCYRRGSRNLQFTAYTSDVSMGEIFTSLSQGATVCIPSDEERMNDLASAMERMRVDWAFLTPSLASLLNPDNVPTLRTLVFGGETATISNVETWAPRLHLINSFGPAETSIWCHAHPHFTTQDDGSDIGWSVGCATWIVDPEDHLKLMPIGTIGELVVEGPNVAAGYYKNAEKTQAAFVKQLPFAPLDKRSRVYRLGDLARWLPDGRVQFLGRKDGQVKLHGQRIEVGEVEHHVRATLAEHQPEPEVAVEMIRNPEDPGDARLVAFISCAQPEQRANAALVEDSNVLQQFKGIVNKMKTLLSQRLAKHMVPTFFVPVSSMPLSASAKTDRNHLRQLIHQMDFSKLSDFAASADKVMQPPRTATEKTLCNIWCSVLGVERDQVGINDDFFELGGDSIAAMKLASLARSAKFTLAVQSVYDNPILSQLALLLDSATEGGDTTSREIEPFSLMCATSPNTIEELRALAADKCALDPCEIDDVYPCTSVQVALVKRTLERRGAFWLYNTFEIPKGLGVDRLETAWDRVVDAFDILRTRIFESKGQWLQAVVQSHVPTIHVRMASVGRFCASDRETPFSAGQRLCRAAFVKEDTIFTKRPSKRYLVLALHHALYDVPTLTKIFEYLEKAYNADTRDSGGEGSKDPLDQPVVAYKHFIQALQQQDEALSSEFWKKSLVGVKTKPFIPSSSRGCIDRALHHRISFSDDLCRRTVKSKTVSSASIVYGALGLAFFRHQQSEDIVFKLVSMGRTSMSLPTIGEIAGPTMTFVPLRINMSAGEHASLDDYLRHVAAQSRRINAFEHFGWEQISEVHQDAAVACAGAVQVVVHPSELYGKQVGESLGLRRKPLSPFSEDDMPLSVDISMQIEGGVLLGLDVRMVYDQHIVPEQKVRRLLQDFETIVSLMVNRTKGSGDSMTVGSALGKCQPEHTEEPQEDPFVVESMEDQYNFEE
jgi:amino acid adenylation domain-containing protein